MKALRSATDDLGCFMRTKLLFICSRNQWRSPTAEGLFRDHAAYDARSAGTSETARIRVGLRLLEWADHILVMERKHKEILLVRFPGFHSPSSIIVLDIPDEYQRDDPELIEVLKDRLLKVLQIGLQ
jgi:predicted protein tyrosine phosphatase